MASTSLLEQPATPELPLFDRPARTMAPASLEQWDRIRLTLTAREREVFLALCDLLDATGHEDATGGEVAEYAGMSVLNSRPRLTGLQDKGWVTRTVETRASRAKYEQRCHAYIPAVPRAAVERVVAA